MDHGTTFDDDRTGYARLEGDINRRLNYYTVPARKNIQANCNIIRSPDHQICIITATI